MGKKNKMVWLSKPYVEVHQSPEQFAKRQRLREELEAEMKKPLIPGYQLPKSERQEIRSRVLGGLQWSIKGYGGNVKRKD